MTAFKTLTPFAKALVQHNMCVQKKIIWRLSHDRIFRAQFPFGRRRGRCTKKQTVIFIALQSLMVWVFVVALSSEPGRNSLSGMLEHSEHCFKELPFPPNTLSCLWEWGTCLTNSQADEKTLGGSVGTERERKVRAQGGPGHSGPLLPTFPLTLPGMVYGTPDATHVCS